MAMPERELDQAKRHPDVVKNIIKKDGRKDAIPYTPSNPPPYPVTSVNGQTGDITIPPTSGGRIWYATCSTASGTGAKTATTSTGDFALATGSMVRVKFTTSNTAANPTMSIDGSTAKTIQPKSGTSGMANLIAAGEVVDLVYDGTNFIMTKGSSATTTFYGITKLNSSTSSTSTTEAATPSAVKDVADAKVDRAGDTMTGNLTVTKAGDTYVVVQDTDTQCRLMMDSYTSGTHGIWSSGYNDGTYHSDGHWLVRRKPDGSVLVDGDCTGTADNVTGTVAVANGGTGATTAAGARGNIGAVNIAGDTMTGNLYVAKAGNAYVQAENSVTGTKLNFDSGSSTNHGIYTYGYYDGSSFHSDPKWMIYRGPDGIIRVNGYAENVTGTVAVAKGGTGATNAASALAALGGCPIVTTDISANSSATFTLSNSGRGVLVLIGAAVKGVYLVNATSSGGISYSSVLAATGATLNTSTNNRLTVSVTGFVTAAMLTISGTIGLV